MLRATRLAATTGSTIRAATRRTPTIRIETPTVTPTSPAITMLSLATGSPAAFAPSSSRTTAASAR
jgi:hypothetical protein